MQIQFEVLPGSADARGLSFCVLNRHLSALGGAATDMHIAQVRPGSVRGNHYHLARRELIAVVYQGAWSFRWESGLGTRTDQRSFTGSGAVLVVPPTGWSHAVVNSGTEDLWLVAVSDMPYDRFTRDLEAKDAYPRVITE